MKSKLEIRAEWLAQLLSTSPADRERAEDGIGRLYHAARFPAPRKILWFDSPFDATLAVALLTTPYHHVWRDKLSSKALSKSERGRVEAAQASLMQRLGTADWTDALGMAGAPRSMNLAWPPDTTRMFHSAFLGARHGLVNNVSELFVVYGEDDDLTRAEAHFAGSNRGVLRSALYCPLTDMLVGQSFFEEYSFSKMADDELRAAGREVPPILGASWDVARSSGLWWPFENVAIASDRPAEIHVNDKYLPHREDGPAVVFRDGSRAFAWNGKTVPERWILEPESVPVREIKGFDPTFAKFVKSKAIPSRGTAAKKRAKPGPILKTALPSDASARLEQLRASAGGQLPFFERYAAGEHVNVWKELVALGPAVRDEAHAADALAVAYATMERVAANVDTLIERLTTLGYQFQQITPASGGGALTMGGVTFDITRLLEQVMGSSRGKPEKPPAPQARTRPRAGIQKTLIDFEKETGVLPLSLRAFYEVVGGVNLMGTHPSLSPSNGEVAPDPLVVDAFDDSAVEYDEDDESPVAISIAPDDLHKANTSGGDPYEIAIPEPSADGQLLNERHELLFVDYLRLCFRFGGFPGYEGRMFIPPEIERLSVGLKDF